MGTPGPLGSSANSVPLYHTYIYNYCIYWIIIMFIHFPYSKQLKLGVYDGFSGHLCWHTRLQTPPIPHPRSWCHIVVMAWWAIIATRCFERMGIGLSVHPPQVWMLLLSSRLLYGNTMVLYGFLMLYHVSFVLQFWWSNTLLSGKIQMSGHQIRSVFSLLGEVMKFAETETLILRTHVLFVSTRNPLRKGWLVWLFRRRRKAQRERLGPP